MLQLLQTKPNNTNATDIWGKFLHHHGKFFLYFNEICSEIQVFLSYKTCIRHNLILDSINSDCVYDNVCKILNFPTLCLDVCYMLFHNVQRRIT